MGLFGRSRSRAHEPDLHFAAKGYVQVMLTRLHAPHINLHRLEQGYAEELLNEGCTREQALSARWGGVYAIQDDPASFELALKVSKEAFLEDQGRNQFRDKDEANKAYVAAAIMLLGSVHTQDPAEYGRFLSFINA